MADPADSIPESVPSFDIEILEKLNLPDNTIRFCMEQDLLQEDVMLLKEGVIGYGLATPEDSWNELGLQAGRNEEKLWLAMLAKNQDDKSIYFCIYHDILLQKVGNLHWYGLIRKSPGGINQTTFSTESHIVGELGSELAYLIYRIVNEYGIVRKTSVTVSKDSVL